MTDLDTSILTGDLDGVRAGYTGPDQALSLGRRPLALAAAAGRVAVVELLAELGAPLDANDEGNLGYTALMHAVRESQPAAVDALLRLGADVDGRDTINGRALHQAGVAGAAEIARRLLAAGAEVDAQDDNGVTPLLRVATQAGRAQWSGPDGEPLPHPLHDAHQETATVLLDAGADPNHLPHDGYSPLHHAAQNGAVALTERLLQSGADANLRNGIGYSVLHAACDANQPSTVRALLAAGADPGPADDSGFVPLHGAAMQGSAEIARLLLEAGAAPDARTTAAYDKVTAGMTPAEAAAAYGHHDLVAVLTVR